MAKYTAAHLMQKLVFHFDSTEFTLNNYHTKPDLLEDNDGHVSDCISY
jgi:hypothetical protein